jgi:mono/diheme cytochrome c family protein
VTVVRRHLCNNQSGLRLPMGAWAMACAALCICLAVQGCARSHSPPPSSELEELVRRSSRYDPLLELQSQGREVFAHYCAICHGAEGTGDGFNSTNLEVPPRDLANPDFWQQTTDERVVLVVSNGGGAVGKSVLMPAWGRTLNDRQIRAVVAFLHTLPDTQAATEGSDAAGSETE